METENLCEVCPRKCKVNRNENCGFCGTKDLKIAKVMKHFGEEPIISGTKGSGTIFFSHCNLKCSYCQNYEISHNGYGEIFSINQLVDCFKLLENSGCHNINLVSPTHYTNEIINALEIYKPKIPIVWNTGGYETKENIELLKNYVDIFLTDLKYSNDKLANNLSNVNNYVKYCTQSILQMRKNQPIDIIEDGIMQKGLIVRHLVLPNHLDNSIDTLKWINDNLGNKTIVSIMSQYLPCYKAKQSIDINRTLKPIEYKIILKYIEKLGFENAFIQELSSNTDELIPNFLNGKIIDMK